MKQEYIKTVEDLLTKADKELIEVENMVKRVNRPIVVGGSSNPPESVTDKYKR